MNHQQLIFGSIVLVFLAIFLVWHLIMLVIEILKERRQKLESDKYVQDLIRRSDQEIK